MAENRQDTPALGKIDYRTHKLEAIWSDIQLLLVEEESLSGDELGTKLDAGKYGYTQKTLANDIIPKLRAALHKQAYIEVDIDDEGRIAKKNWRLPG